MSDWFREMATEAWDPAKRRLPPGRPESPASTWLSALEPLPSPQRSDDPPDGNVWTLANGDRLDTAEKFFDWLECHYRDDVEAGEPCALDQLVELRQKVVPRANDLRCRSYN